MWEERMYGTRNARSFYRGSRTVLTSPTPPNTPVDTLPFPRQSCVSYANQRHPSSLSRSPPLTMITDRVRGESMTYSVFLPPASHRKRCPLDHQPIIRPSGHVPIEFLPNPELGISKSLSKPRLGNSPQTRHSAIPALPQRRKSSGQLSTDDLDQISSHLSGGSTDRGWSPVTTESAFTRASLGQPESHNSTE